MGVFQNVLICTNGLFILPLYNNGMVILKGKSNEEIYNTRELDSRDVIRKERIVEVTNKE